MLCENELNWMRVEMTFHFVKEMADVLKLALHHSVVDTRNEEQEGVIGGE